MVITVSDNNVPSWSNCHALGVAFLSHSIEARGKGGFQTSIFVKNLNAMIILVGNNHVIIHIKRDARGVLEH